jgi:hypothetical protein
MGCTRFRRTPSWVRAGGASWRDGGSLPRVPASLKRTSKRHQRWKTWVRLEPSNREGVFPLAHRLKRLDVFRQVRGKAVLIGFDRVIERARERLKEQPTRTTLSRIERSRAPWRSDTLPSARLQRRHAGEPVETPRHPELGETSTSEGGTLRAAFQGWRKARNPSAGTLTEYERGAFGRRNLRGGGDAVFRPAARWLLLFTELHGDVPVVNIKRSHARQFREAMLKGDEGGAKFGGGSAVTGTVPLPLGDPSTQRSMNWVVAQQELERQNFRVRGSGCC